MKVTSLGFDLDPSVVASPYDVLIYGVVVLVLEEKEARERAVAGVSRSDEEVLSRELAHALGAAHERYHWCLLHVCEKIVCTWLNWHSYYYPTFCFTKSSYFGGRLGQPSHKLCLPVSLRVVCYIPHNQFLALDHFANARANPK